MSIKKTNAARMLDDAGIAYTLHAFDVDEQDLSATSAARNLGVPSCEVFKTLVARGDKHGIMLALIPGHTSLALKKLATLSGNKKVELVALREVLPLTGYMRGGCSPVGTKKAYPVCIDSTALLNDHIYVSAGQRGLQFRLEPRELARLTGAVFGDIALAP